MSLCADSLQSILTQPLSYVHRQRLHLASALDTPALRGHLNQMLSEQLSNLDPEQALSSIAGAWVEHWFLIPEIASLTGAWLAWPALAKGGRLIGLSAGQRRFATLQIASRRNRVVVDDSPLPGQLQALGLNALLAFHKQVPSALIDRLVLQFSTAIVARQRDLPPASPDAALLRLAIQHARFDPHID